MYIAILGRQPALGSAELERLYTKVSWFSDASVLVDTPAMDIQRLGGTQKAGRVVLDLPSGDYSKASLKIVQHYAKKWHGYDSKITLGISAYNFPTSPRHVQKTGLVLKAKLKSAGVSLRLVPNADLALNTATSHHNKLGLSDNKVELLVVKATNGRIVVAESIGAQNITALAARDQGRPKRDAFVGMLPPKLAQIMINLALGDYQAPDDHAPQILDPFCGTGVILQEALLQGYDVFGSDLNPKMIDYTTKNLSWLQDTHKNATGTILTIREGDATTYKWLEASNIEAVVTETYLGQPFSAPPSPAKLTEVRGNCNHIISQFLKNLASQTKPGTLLCIAIPAWRDTQGNFTHLPLINKLSSLGYTRHQFKTVTNDQLLYHRPDQVVGRELLVLTRSQEKV